MTHQIKSKCYKHTPIWLWFNTVIMINHEPARVNQNVFTIPTLWIQSLL